MGGSVCATVSRHHHARTLKCPTSTALVQGTPELHLLAHQRHVALDPRLLQTLHLVQQIVHVVVAGLHGWLVLQEGSESQDPHQSRDLQSLSPSSCAHINTNKSPIPACTVVPLPALHTCSCIRSFAFANRAPLFSHAQSSHRTMRSSLHLVSRSLPGACTGRPTFQPTYSRRWHRPHGRRLAMVSRLSSLRAELSRHPGGGWHQHSPPLLSSACKSVSSSARVCKKAAQTYRNRRVCVWACVVLRAGPAS